MTTCGMQSLINRLSVHGGMFDLQMRYNTKCENVNTAHRPTVNALQRHAFFHWHFRYSPVSVIRWCGWMALNEITFRPSPSTSQMTSKAPSRNLSTRRRTLIVCSWLGRFPAARPIGTTTKCKLIPAVGLGAAAAAAAVAINRHPQHSVVVNVTSFPNGLQYRFDDCNYSYYSVTHLE